MGCYRGLCPSIKATALLASPHCTPTPSSNSDSTSHLLHQGCWGGVGEAEGKGKWCCTPVSLKPAPTFVNNPLVKVFSVAQAEYAFWVLELCPHMELGHLDGSPAGLGTSHPSGCQSEGWSPTLLCAPCRVPWASQAQGVRLSHLEGPGKSLVSAQGRMGTGACGGRSLLRGSWAAMQ